MEKQHIGWNHNNHYHDFLLGHVPAGAVRALDIGCGSGEFAHRLADVCQTVDAVDPDSGAIDLGRKRYVAYSNINFYCSPFEEIELVENQYDFVSAIAAVHHMPLESTLAHMKQLLKPNGILAILGLYKEETATDLLWSMAAIPVHKINHARWGLAEESSDHQMVTQSPSLGLGEIRRVANGILPAHQFKRHLFWRYSIIWRKLV